MSAKRTVSQKKGEKAGSNKKLNSVQREGLIEHVNDGVVILDTEDNITFINQKAVDLRQEDSVENLIGKNAWAGIFKDTGSTFKESCKEAAKTGKPVFIEGWYQPRDRYFQSRIYPSSEGLTIYFTDTTENKIIEKDLKDNLDLMEEAQEIAHLGNWYLDIQNETFQWSDEMYRIFGLLKDDFSPTVKSFLSLIHPDDRKLMDDWMNQSLAGVKPRPLELRIVTPKGETRWIRGDGRLTFDQERKADRMIGFVLDITNRKKVELEIQKERTFIKKIIDATPNIIFIYDIKKKIPVFTNLGSRKFLGYSDEEIKAMGVDLNDRIMHPDDAIQFKKNNQDVYPTLKDEDVLEFDARLKTNTGQWRNFFSREYVFSRNPDGSVAQIFGIVVDVTERKRAEKLLKDSEERYRLLINDSPNAIGVIQKNKVVFVNPAAVRVLKAKDESDFVGKSVQDFFSKGQWNNMNDRITRMLNGEKGLFPIEEQMIRLDGKIITVELFASLVTFNRKPAVQIITLDITERKKAERKLANEALRHRLLIEQSRDGIVVIDETGKVREINLRFAKMLGYDKKEAMTLHVWDWDSSIPKNELVQMMKNVDETGDHFETKHKRKDGTVIDVEISTNGAKFNGEKLIFCVVRDITERKKAQSRLEKTLGQLRQMLGTTIEALVHTTEIRDPYTAGHQKRVADLAGTIASELDLPEDQIQGLRMAASIHDIGKISIPSEILSKPSSLTELEYSVVKEHPRYGKEILENVSSPWPIADIIYQHHEKMDGSGYPLGLKGDEIKLEARILCVADVVEAMASHRPYRPSLGIDAALDEIEKHKAVLFDAQVVDVCLKLFREKSYEFPEEAG